MAETAEAIYENGLLRPLTRLSLDDGQRVHVTVEPILPPTRDDETFSAEKPAKRTEAEGAFESLMPPTEPFPADWRPIALEGEPLSETILRMRREE